MVRHVGVEPTLKHLIRVPPTTSQSMTDRARTGIEPVTRKTDLGIFLVVMLPCIT